MALFLLRIQGCHSIGEFPGFPCGSVRAVGLFGVRCSAACVVVDVVTVDAGSVV
jgi:hypothetical protein